MWTWQSLGQVTQLEVMLQPHASEGPLLGLGGAQPRS
jgi:hypothetical protein